MCCLATKTARQAVMGVWTAEHIYLSALDPRLGEHSMPSMQFECELLAVPAGALLLERNPLNTLWGSCGCTRM